MHQFNENPESLDKASIFRRLAAAGYDALLCLALLMTTTGLYMLIANVIIGSEKYKVMTEAGKTLHDPLLSSILFIVLYSFFAYFWTKNGQTLGMQAWHLRIQNSNNTSISLTQALLRFLMAAVSAACFGLGYLWMLIDKKDRTWQCMFSDTQVVRMPKRKD
mgnify:CR=1 FL=1